MSEPAIQSINQHTQKTSLDWLYNILIQPSSGDGSGVSPATHEQFGLSLDLLRQALVEVDNVVNVLTTAVPGKVLDARQGKVLADAIAAILAQKAAANGIATLGSDGKIPSAQIPSIALVDVFPVSSEAAMLSSGAEQGDMAIRSDTSQVFILSASPATTVENWIELSALKALVDAAVADLAGAGRTTETVKGNADAIVAMKGEGYDGQTLIGLDHRIDNILEGQDLDPNKDVELLDSRHSNVSDETYASLGERLDGIDESYNRAASWSAKRFGLRFYTDTGEFARIGDAAGMVHRNHAGSYTPGVYSDFSFEDPWGGIKPCKMDDDGHILGWYGDPGYELLDGDEMAFIPRVFTGWTGNVVGGRPCIDIEASPAQLPGLYPTGFIGMNGELLRGIYAGRTKLGTSGGKLKSGANLAPTVNKSMNSFNTDLRAKSATAKWRLNDFTAWMVQTTLMAIEIGTFDVKTAIGPGVQGLSNSYSASNVCTVATTDANTFIMAKTRSQYFKVGMMVQIGTAHTNAGIASDRNITDIAEYDETNDTVTVDGAVFTTTITSTIATWGQIVPVENMDALKGESGYITRFGSASQSNVCWRWIWDLWGNVWEWLGGVLRVDGKFYLCFDRDDYQSSTPVGKAGWIDTGYAPVAENGYQKEREVITYRNGQISLPKTTGGSGVGANSWYAAYLYYFGADYQTSVRAVRVGGTFYDGVDVSPFCWYGDYGPASADIHFGGRSVIEKEAA